ncbi:hypothetical protein ACFV3R_25630 [Streptomyces sp. NPDC059740]|uniref:hypothetical protein n=1 Tax=Streptomyces sp. NPDC059740 TaxID=3346926 RepID=UPI0036524B31
MAIKTTPAPESRYIIGHDGVFATLYDRQAHRVVVENATEEHCLRRREELVQAEEIRELADALPVDMRHQLLDLDTDSTCRLPGFTCPNAHPQGQS